MNRRYRKWFLFLLIIAMGLVAAVRIGYSRKGRQRQLLTVTRVVDGDTLVLDNGEKIRLKGVDTPESVHPNKPVEPFGPEAREFTRTQLQGVKVYLILDENDTANNHRDRYGRLLAYVFRNEDDLDFNAELLKRGLARVEKGYPCERLDEFHKYQEQAQKQKLGLWGSPDKRKTPWSYWQIAGIILVGALLLFISLLRVRKKRLWTAN
jgi:micrococcal nuclease